MIDPPDMPVRDTRSRLSRLEEIKGLLKAREEVTVAALASELGVSQRTAARDIALLRDTGMPIEADRGRGGGIRLQRNWPLGRLQLDAGEAIELLLSLALAEQMSLPLLPRKLAPVRRKILAAFGERLQADIKHLRRRILVASPPSAAVLSTYSAPAGQLAPCIADGFFKLKCLDISYRDRDGVVTQRIVEPQFLLLTPPIWYLLAFDRLRQGIRHFRIDRITDCHVLAASFRLASLKSYRDFVDESFREI